jgi:hypothetical protein
MTNKEYIWKLACFLHEYDKKMSMKELAEHLNRNGFTTSYGSQYKGKRGTNKLVSATYDWISKEHGLPAEAQKVADAYVGPSGRAGYK